MSAVLETEPIKTESTTSEHRNAGGRFAEGNLGGPGNPSGCGMAFLRRAMLNCVTAEDIVAVTKAVIKEAADGNMAAAKLLFHYVLGKPGAPADADLFAMAAPITNGSNGRSNAPEFRAAPKANGSNGNPDASKVAAAPKANGSNGGKGSAAPTGLGAKAEEWLNRQLSRDIEGLVAATR